MRGNSPTTLLVLAAGMGSRYGGLKQLDSVGPSGETILDYSVYDALRAGFGKVVFVIRKEIGLQFREMVGASFRDRIQVEYAFQEVRDIPAGFSVPSERKKPWGTAHAVLVASALIHEPFAVINADDYYGTESFHALAQQLKSETTDQTMIAFLLRNTLSEFGVVSRGVCSLDADDYLSSVTEMTGLERDGPHARNTDIGGRSTYLNGDELVSMNMWGFRPKVFDWLREYFRNFLSHYESDLQSECFLPGMVNEMVVQRQMRVKVLRTQDSWFGITYREDLPRVVENIQLLVESGVYPRRLW